MKNKIRLVAVIFTLMMAAVLLTACNNEGVTVDAPVELSPGTQTPEPTPVTTQKPTQEWTIEELGAKIVAAGTFWEEWWQLGERFGYIEWVPPEWDADGDVWMPQHLAERGISSMLLPSSGFADINDVRDYLLQYHTAEWVEWVLFSEHSVIIEYDGILYIHDARAGFPRPRWEDATHVLIEQEGGRAVVETTFLFGSWHRGYDFAYPSKAIYRFIFIDGKIENGLGPWVHSEREDITFEALPWTIGQLGRIIEGEGFFWESWWAFTFTFDSSHIDWQEQIEIGLENTAFARLLPSSGFENLDGIRNRMWNYTEDWTERLLSGENPPFIEHDGMLYINVERPNTPRPDWDTAAHTMIEQDGQHAVVETTVYMFYFPYPPTITEARFRITFAGSRIDSVYRVEN